MSDYNDTNVTAREQFNTLFDAYHNASMALYEFHCARALHNEGLTASRVLLSALAQSVALAAGRADMGADIVADWHKTSGEWIDIAYMNVI